MPNFSKPSKRLRLLENPNKRKRKKILLIGLASIFILLFVVSTATYFPAQSAVQHIFAIKKISQELSPASITDISVLRGKLTEIDEQNAGLQKDLRHMPWLSVFPIVGSYYHDLQHLSKALASSKKSVETIIDVIEPFVEDINSEDSSPEVNRVVQISSILGDLKPHLDDVINGFSEASNEMGQIKTAKYPTTFRGASVRPELEKIISTITQANAFIVNARPTLEVASSLLGEPEPKQYLLVFQNDKELRATGGFLSSYSYVTLNKGEITTTTSEDLYTLSNRIYAQCQKVDCGFTPPPPIQRYLRNDDGSIRKFWSILDVNISPDVPTSIAMFDKMYTALPNAPQYDGIILVDTHVVEEFLKITGPITVRGTEFSLDTEPLCNCTKVIYELERYAELIDPSQPDRKSIIGDLMQEILEKTLTAPANQFPTLFQVTGDLFQRKDVVLYMHDENIQSALSLLNWTGAINQTTNGDYLHINDSNFGGKKSNLYIEQNVQLHIDDSSNEKNVNTLTITYTNPQKDDGWLNHIYHAYVRVYVPQGSNLTQDSGSVNPVTVIPEELGKTVFESFVKVNPLQSQTLTFTYEVPRDKIDKESYSLFIQKQPGKKAFPYTISIDGSANQNIVLSSDKYIRLQK